MHAFICISTHCLQSSALVTSRWRRVRAHAPAQNLDVIACISGFRPVLLVLQAVARHRLCCPPSTLTGLLLCLAQVFSPIAFVSSLLGVTVIGYLVRRSGRASIIIILMVRCTWQNTNTPVPANTANVCEKKQNMG